MIHRIQCTDSGHTPGTYVCNSGHQTWPIGTALHLNLRPLVAHVTRGQTSMYKFTHLPPELEGNYNLQLNPGHGCTRLHTAAHGCAPLSTMDTAAHLCPLWTRLNKTAHLCPPWTRLHTAAHLCPPWARLHTTARHCPQHLHSPMRIGPMPGWQMSSDVTKL